MKRNVSIICGDGGLRGSYIGGALSELVVQIPNHFDRIKAIYACSTSFGSASYYLSHQHDHPGKQIWTEAISNSEFLAFGSVRSLISGKPIFNIDVLADDIIKRKYPLSVSRIIEHEIELIAPAYDLQAEKVVYFTNRRERELSDPDTYIFLGDVDYYQAIKAVKAAPVLYDQAVIIKGRPLCDAGVVEPFRLDLSQMAETRRLLIAASYKIGPQTVIGYGAIGLVRALLSFTGTLPGLGPAVYVSLARKPFTLKRVVGQAKELEAENKLYVLSPRRPLHSYLDSHRGGLAADFEAGVTQVQSEIKRIISYINPS